MSLPKFPGSYGGQGVSVGNSSAVAQTPAAATRTYIAGSALRIPPGGLKVGDRFSWKFSLTKTAAGTATSTIDIAVGTAGTTADTARVSFTKPAGTAAIDEGVIEVEAVVRGVAAATTGILVGEFELRHNGDSVGHATVPVVVLSTVGAAFDNTGEELVVGLCITTGASDVITINVVTADYTRATAA